MTTSTTNSQAASFRSELLPILRNMYLRLELDAIDDEICSVLDMIDAKLAQARSNALQEAAKICDDIGRDYRDQYKGRGQYEPNNPHRADPYADGAADGAWNCESAITALLQQQGQADTSGLPG